MTLLGLLAGALTTGCWLPQLIKSWRTRSTADVSWAYLAVFGTGIGLWMLYGLFTRDVAIVVTNGLTLTLTIGFALTKARFDVVARRVARGATTADTAPLRGGATAGTTAPLIEVDR